MGGSLGGFISEIGRGFTNVFSGGTAELFGSNLLNKAFGSESQGSLVSRALSLSTPASAPIASSMELSGVYNKGDTGGGLTTDNAPDIKTETNIGIGTVGEGGGKTYDEEEESKKKAISKKKMGAKALQIPLTAPISAPTSGASGLKV